MEVVPKRPLGNLRVLLVEDSADIREVFAMLLRGEGARVVATESGLEAVHLVRSETFDVLLTDLGLPDLPGEMVVRQAATARPRPRIVVVTGFGEPFVSQARDAGADVVLLKPVSWASLVAQLCGRPASTEAPAVRAIRAIAA